MCYVCRKDIRDIGYKHFCQHFRQIPGRACEECRECDLYVTEDEEGKIKEAREIAEKEYWERHKKPVSWKGTMIGPEGLGKGKDQEVVQERLERFMQWTLEMVVEAYVEFL